MHCCNTKLSPEVRETVIASRRSCTLIRERISVIESKSCTFRAATSCPLQMCIRTRLSKACCRISLSEGLVEKASLITERLTSQDYRWTFVRRTFVNSPLRTGSHHLLLPSRSYIPHALTEVPTRKDSDSLSICICDCIRFPVELGTEDVVVWI